MQHTHHSSECIHELFTALSKRWMLHIFHVFIFNKELRFNDIKSQINGISPKMLSQRLTELEELGFIARNVISDKPIKVTYSMTQKTEDLFPIFHECIKWAEKWGV